MNLSNEFTSIRLWARNKGILEHGNSYAQLTKLTEECGELARAIIKNDKKELVDAIGDCVVVLTNLAAMNDLRIEECINTAYQVIKDRTGQIKNGNFIKDVK